jgi:hypothetical protein
MKNDVQSSLVSTLEAEPTRHDTWQVCTGYLTGGQSEPAHTSAPSTGWPL